ncbi:MAG: methylated-DNA--[protein]-cysteine S-methyltransferase [Candidatus Tumulicola sp.]
MKARRPEHALFWDCLASPVGTLYFSTSETALRALDFDRFASRTRELLHLQDGDPEPERRRADPLGVRARLTAYFDGNLGAFDDLPIAMDGTPFQRCVWNQLRTIEPGTTISYGELAARIGSRNGARAVGLANGSNPIAIVVPCHRVIGSSGKLVGYGGGMARKAWLLRHESRQLRLDSK